MDNKTKHRKAGYQGKKDSMRDKAEKLMGYSGKLGECSDKSKAKGYMGGGHAKKGEYMEGGPTRKMKGGTVKKNSVQKFAMGGVAKIRHEEATSQGLPKSFKKKSLKDIL